VTQPETERPLEITISNCKDNIKLDLIEDLNDVDWVRLMMNWVSGNKVEYLWVALQLRDWWFWKTDCVQMKLASYTIFFKCRFYYNLQSVLIFIDRLCGLVVRVPGYRSRGPRFDFRRYKIFWEIVGLERGPLSLVRIIEELLEWINSGFGQENRINDLGDPLRWPRDTLYPQKLALTSPTSGGRSISRYSSLAD
jgi:hypothetical protein